MAGFFVSLTMAQTASAHGDQPQAATHPTEHHCGKLKGMSA